ncbi:MAG: response regulator [Holophaga sp.]|nr:response regulator [Holophaga sp.]
MECAAAPAEGRDQVFPSDDPGGDSLRPKKSLEILLVDDDDLIRMTVGPMLEILGHKVQAVEGGQQALDLFEQGLKVDLVILDMNMPFMNGAETLQRLMLVNPDQPVLMASGYDNRDVRGLLQGNPKVGIIQKPFSLGEFQEKLVALHLLSTPR